MEILKGKTVMLVEDDPVLSAVETRILERSGMRVLRCYNGQQAVEQARIAVPLDLVLMDIDLGRGIDGVEAARIILRERDLPLIFLSVSIEKAIVEKLDDITSYGYVLKNTGELVLLASMKMALKLHELKQELQRKEERYRVLFYAHPSPMWIYDLATLDFLEVNNAAVSRYGYTRERFLSMKISEIRPPEDIPRLLESVAAVAEGFDPAGLWRHLKADGTVIDVDIASHTLDWNGKRAELVMATLVPPCQGAAKI